MSSYIDYDELGIKEIRCMNCNHNVIQTRVIAEIKGRTALTMRRNSSFRTKDINILTKGKPSFLTAMLCAECVNIFDTQTVVNNAMDGMREAKRYEGRSDEDIEQFISTQYFLEVE